MFNIAAADFDYGIMLRRVEAINLEWWYINYFPIPRIIHSQTQQSKMLLTLNIKTHSISFPVLRKPLIHALASQFMINGRQNIAQFSLEFHSLLYGTGYQNTCWFPQAYMFNRLMGAGVIWNNSTGNLWNWYPILKQQTVKSTMASPIQNLLITVK